MYSDMYAKVLSEDMGQSRPSAEAFLEQSRKVIPTVRDAVFQELYDSNGWARTTPRIVRGLENCALQKKIEESGVL